MSFKVLGVNCLLAIITRTCVVQARHNFRRNVERDKGDDKKLFVSQFLYSSEKSFVKSLD